MSALPTVESLIAKLSALGITLPPGPVRVDSYGDSPALSEELLDLIKSGRKRAGTGLLWAYEVDGEAIPKLGDIEIVVDHRNEPALVTRITGVEIIPYSAVNAEYAAIEGEGDGSLDYWRKGHWAFFTRECHRIGRESDESMPVMCSVFEILNVVGASCYIRLAELRDAPLLPGIELEAARLFLEYIDVLGLTTEMLENTNSVEQFVRAQQAGLLWVAVNRDGAPQGFALLCEIDGYLHLDELDVHPSHGRRGIGAALLQRVCRSAQSSGHPAVTLSTFRDVPWNAPFYAQHGFRVLRDEELTPGLTCLREEEQGRGLRTGLRVIMRYDCL